jgi:hypothetical protein
VNGVDLRRLVIATALAVVALLRCAVLSAQELEPGTYQNAPVGVNVVYTGYGFSTGNVLFDAALPIQGASAKVHAVSFGFLRTLDLFGRLAKIDAQIPVSWGRFQGEVEGEFRTRTPRGLADPRVRLSINLAGSPALDLPAFATFRQRTIVGTSVLVVMPLGLYDRTRFINLGANRWAFRPEAAVSHARGRWIFEAAAGAWLFTDNADYVGGTTLSQAPFYFAKGSVIYTLRRNLWFSVSYGRGSGGETRVDDLARHDLQRNDRIGATLSFPAGRSGALRVLATSGLATRLGTDFDSIGVGYQYAWGPARRRP